MEYNLEKSTRKFSKDVINCCRNIKINRLNSNIISQLLRSATSVGANYHEANAAISKRDFKNKIHICRKEIQETDYWLDLLNEVDEGYKEFTKNIEKETKELILIFSKISSTLKIIN